MIGGITGVGWFRLDRGRLSRGEVGLGFGGWLVSWVWTWNVPCMCTYLVQRGTDLYMGEAIESNSLNQEFKFSPFHFHSFYLPISPSNWVNTKHTKMTERYIPFLSLIFSNRTVERTVGVKNKC